MFEAVPMVRGSKQFLSMVMSLVRAYTKLRNLLRCSETKFLPVLAFVFSLLGVMAGLLEPDSKRKILNAKSGMSAMGVTR